MSLSLPSPEPSAAQPSSTIILCANRRLIEHLEAAALAKAKGGPIERPPVHTVGEWLNHLWLSERDRLSLRGETSLPYPIAEELRLLLWEKAISEALAQAERGGEPTDALRLVGDQRLAEGMAQAFALAMAHGLSADELENAARDGSPLEQRLFARALPLYRQILAERHWIDPSELAREVAQRIGKGQFTVPSTLRFVGFREHTPVLTELAQAFQKRGTTIDDRPPNKGEGFRVLERLPDPRAELRAAAEWAAKQLEEKPEARIAIVVCDLHTRRSEVLAVLDQVLCPKRKPGQARPYTLSLGAPLAQWFPVRDALAWLRWLLAEDGLPLAQARACLLSPAWRSDDHALLSREWEEREALPPRVRPEDFGIALPEDPRDDQGARQDARSWAERFRALLDAIGFPGIEPLDRAAFQALDRFEETLGRFASLSPFLGALRANEALARLERLCHRRLFQPQGPIARLQVLGPLEAVGLSFDAAWIVGLNEGRFPPAREPNPFLPFELQKKKGMPGTDATADAEHDRGWWRSLLGIAPELRVSYAEREEDDRPLLPSWLVAGAEATRGAATPLPPFWRKVHQSRQETEADEQWRKPWPVNTTIQGGAQRVRDHLDCPFRGFALHELAARRPRDPLPPPDAREFGIILHKALARLAEEAAMNGQPPASLAHLSRDAIAPALEEALRSPLRAGRRRPAHVEAAVCDELKRRIERLLEAEKARPADGAIIAVEGKSLDGSDPPPDALVLAGYTIRLRCDRIDRLPNGALAVIDYKTGQARGPGRGEKLADPQLALYALLDERIQAVVYARLDDRDEGPVFSGYAADRTWFPNPRIGPPGDADGNWYEGLRKGWRESLSKAVAAIGEGAFPAEPRPGVCQRCELAASCRIRERKGTFDLSDTLTEDADES